MLLIIATEPPWLKSSNIRHEIKDQFNQRLLDLKDFADQTISAIFVDELEESIFTNLIRPFQSIREYNTTQSTQRLSLWLDCLPPKDSTYLPSGVRISFTSTGVLLKGRIEMQADLAAFKT